MKDEEQVPDPHLMDSMRSVGYSLESALADLIDNSLSAGATNIEVLFRSGDEPFVGILDDGNGMDSEQARTALRLAGTNTAQSRGEKDLGRFGLGLKTASLSQARVLTVVTKRDGVITGLEWDLDYLVETGKWSLKVLDEDDLGRVPLADRLEARPAGTFVIWRNLDLLVGDARNPATYLSSVMAEAAQHLELVFHRFLSGEGIHRAVRMSVNGRGLKPVDPFLEKHPATQRSPLERFGDAGTQITVQAFTLPHLSKLTKAEQESARVGARMRDSQGFYVYRNRRLIDWGSWFRLTPKDELAKLARVRVDVPNSLDGLWGLDIKKSRAVPPDSVRQELKRLIERIVGQSKKAHTYRGRTDDSQDDGTFVWQVVQARDSFEYKINREHPLLLPEGGRVTPERLEVMLDLIETMFPVHDVYARMSGDVQPDAPSFSDEFLLSAAGGMWRHMRDALNSDFTRFTALIVDIEPFNQRRDAQNWLESKRKEIEYG